MWSLYYKPHKNSENWLVEESGQHQTMIELLELFRLMFPNIPSKVGRS